MNDVDLPDYEKCRLAIEQTISETREVLQEAFSYIRREEDGPTSMRFALNEIDHLVGDFSRGLRSLVTTVDGLHALLVQVQQQRDEARLQRDVLRDLLISISPASDEVDGVDDVVSG